MTPDGTLIGLIGNTLYASADEGASWAIIPYSGDVNAFPEAVRDCRVMSDGGLLVRINDVDTPCKLYRTPGSAWDEHFNLVLTMDTINGNPPNYFGSFVCGDVAVLNEYGSPIGPNLYVSWDKGATWGRVFTTPESADPASNHHIHSAAYDPYDDLLWIVTGDNLNRMIYYSRDRGDTWQAIGEFGSFTDNLLQIAILPNCILFGTDIYNASLFKLDRVSSGDYTAANLLKVFSTYLMDQGVPISSRPATDYGAASYACYFSYAFTEPTFTEMGDLYATRDGVTFYRVGQSPTAPSGTSGTRQYGPRVILGPTTSGYLYLDYWVNASDRRLVRVAVPTWS